MCRAVAWYSWRSQTTGWNTAIRGRKLDPSTQWRSTSTAVSKSTMAARDGSTPRYSLLILSLSLSLSLSLTLCMCQWRPNTPSATQNASRKSSGEGDEREWAFLLQRVSVLVQRYYNAVLLQRCPSPWLHGLMICTQFCVYLDFKTLPGTFYRTK